MLVLRPQVFVALSALLYGVGIAVVSLHLGSYGITDGDLIRSRFVMAGLWACLPIAGVAVIKAAARDQMSAKRRGFAGCIVSLLWRVVAVSIGFGMMIMYRSQAPDAGQWWSFASGLLGCLLMGGLVLADIDLVRTPACVPPDLDKAEVAMTPAEFRQDRRWLHGAVAAIEAITYVLLFSYSLYPLVPSAWGGGRAVRMSLELSSDYLEGLPTYVCERTGLQSGFVDVIHESEHDLSIRSTDGAFVVRIPKSVVRAMVVLGDRGAEGAASPTQRTPDKGASR